VVGGGSHNFLDDLWGMPVVDGHAGELGPPAGVAEPARSPLEAAGSNGTDKETA
jgi:hypothetical protein